MIKLFLIVSPTLLACIQSVETKLFMVVGLPGSRHHPAQYPVEEEGDRSWCEHVTTQSLTMEECSARGHHIR